MAEEKKATTTRVTAAQVDNKVEALTETVEALAEQVGGLETGIGSIVEMLTEERAAKKIAEAKAEAQAALAAENALANEAVERRSAHLVQERAPVGERDGDVYVRNLHERSLRVRIGKQSDPFRINLAPRGQKGDTTAVPASLRGDLGYRNNLGVAFEEISDQEMMSLAGRRSRRRQDPELEKARRGQTVRDEDRTVAHMRDATPEDRLTRVGPRYVDLPGSHNPSNALPESELTRADAEADPEYRMWLQWKQQQAAERQGALGHEVNERPQKVISQSAADRIAEAAASGDPEAQAMARYVQKMEAKGVLPPGELSKPVTVERATISVQPRY